MVKIDTIFVSFFLLLVVLPIWIKDTFTCKNSSRQAIIRLCATKRGSVWREIEYWLLYCLLITPAVEMPKQEIELLLKKINKNKGKNKNKKLKIKKKQSSLSLVFLKHPQNMVNGRDLWLSDFITYYLLCILSNEKRFSISITIWN